MSHMLSLKNLSVSVEKKTIIKDFTFQFKKGNIYAIMGPNGSGKSTLAYSLMGHPSYSIKRGKIKLAGNDITNKKPNERAKLGLFLSFQTPLSLAGVNIFQLLLVAMRGKREPLAIRQDLESYAKELKIKHELIERALNEGASGGEKKKLEVLQAAVLAPDVLIFDEVDTGVDIDALKTIAEFIRKHKKGRTYILITHYNRILKYLKPDEVLILIGGKLMKTGDHKLAHKIEEKGYDWITKTA